MTKLLIRPALALVLSGLVSCTTYYKNAPGDVSRNAILTSTSTGGFYKYENYKVMIVDNLPLNYTWESAGTKKCVLTPGKHLVSLRCEFSRGVNSIGNIAEDDVTLRAEAGKSYRANGYIEGSKAVMWIQETSTGKVVTEKKKAQLYLPPQSGRVPVFIPIPVG